MLFDLNRAYREFDRSVRFGNENYKNFQKLYAEFEKKRQELFALNKQLVYALQNAEYTATAEEEKKAINAVLRACTDNSIRIGSLYKRLEMEKENLKKLK